MRGTAFLAAIIFTASMAAADPSAIELTDYRAAAIDETQAEIETVKRRIAQYPETFKAISAKHQGDREALQAARVQAREEQQKDRARLGRLMRGEEIAPPGLFRSLPLTPGRIGTLAVMQRGDFAGHIIIHQIIGPETMLAEWQLIATQTHRTPNGLGGFDSRRSESKDSVWVWVEGVSTDGLAAPHGATPELKATLAETLATVEGTKTYPTAFGSRTVWVVRPVDEATAERLRRPTPDAPSPARPTGP